MSGDRKTQAALALEQLPKTLGGLLKERTTAFAKLEERLADEAALKATTTEVPIQLEGKLHSGELIYFRARGQSARLDLWCGEKGLSDLSKERFRHPDASAEVERWAWPEAGWLEADDVEGVFRELLVAVRATVRVAVQPA